MNIVKDRILFIVEFLKFQYTKAHLDENASLNIFISNNHFRISRLIKRLWAEWNWTRSVRLNAMDGSGLYIPKLLIL